MDRFNMDTVFDRLPVNLLTRNRKFGITQDFLIIGTLAVIPHEDSEIFPGKVVAFAQFLYPTDYLEHFLDGCVRHPHLGRAIFPKNRIAARALRVPGAQHLPQPEGCVLEDVIRQVQYVRSRTVIPLQPDKRTLLEVVTKAVDVPDIRPAKTVYGLVVVPDDKQAFPIAKKCFDHAVLRRVYILVFIHQDFRPLPVEILSRLLVAFKQANRLEYQILKYDLPTFEYGLPEFRNAVRHRRSIRIIKEIFTVELQATNMEAREFIHKIAIRRFLRHRRLLESDHFVSIHATNLLLEHIKRKRMERTEPHSRAGKQRLHAFPHLGSGRRRKCKRQDVFGIHPHGNPVLDPFRKDRCLSRARSRKDKQLRSLLMIM